MTLQLQAPEAPETAERAPTRYWPGLDGMRAVAVAAVVAYHLAPGVLPGGFIGVDVFFVISGYLITSLLVRERDRCGRVRLPLFWGRRVRRLYPAVIALVAVLVPVAAIWQPAAVASSRATFAMALVYSTNWWFIFHHVPYFQRFGPPPLLLHLWSLAIEEQYYLVWPPVLLLLLRRWRPTQVARVALVGAAASGLAMALLYHGAGSVNRVYFGSDTHAEGLLLGSALGLLLPPGSLGAVFTGRRRQLLDRAGAVALAGLVLLAVLAGQGDPFTWRGGIVLAVALAAVAAVAAAHPGTRCSAVLSTPPLRWLGTRSYSVYLWHWPIIVLTDPGGAMPLPGTTGLLVRLVAITAAAEASYRLVEQPWRTGTAQAALRRLAGRSPAWRWSAAGGVAVAAGTVVALVVAVSAPTLPEASIGTATVAASRRVTPLAASRAEAASSGGPRAPAAPTPPGPAAGGPVLAIGDSVMLAAAPDLERVFGPTITVDAVVGRQVQAGLDRLAAYRAAGRLQGLRALVVGLGSNGPFTEADLTQLRQLAAGVPLVVLVNVRVPDPWEPVSDLTIDGAAADPGFRVVDWYTASGNPQLLWPDGVHPDPAGQQVYATMVAQAVTGQQPGSSN